MRAAAVNAEPPASITPPVHLEFIQNQAALPDCDDVEQVEAYHRALFLHHHAGEIEQARQQARTHEDRLLYLERRLNDARSRLIGTEQLLPVTCGSEPDVKPSAPWNLWDRAMFSAALLGILGLLVFGVLNISFNLLESGLVTFVETPVRAYFWAALLPVGALAVKVGWDFLESQKLRAIYLWSCLALGIAGVLVWVAAYASVYPTLSKSVSENIQSLSVFDTGSTGTITSTGAKWVDAITVAAQALAEIFLSAVLGIHMTAIYLRHRPVRLAANPLFTQAELERRSLEDEVAHERSALAAARGQQTRLENQLEALVAYAKSIFHKEAASRRDEARKKQSLLDEISEQLRNRLGTISTNGAHAPAEGSRTLRNEAVR